MYTINKRIAVTTRVSDSSLMIAKCDLFTVNDSVTDSDPNGPRCKREDLRPRGHQVCVKQVGDHAYTQLHKRNEALLSKVDRSFTLT